MSEIADTLCYRVLCACPAIAGLPVETGMKKTVGMLFVALVIGVSGILLGRYAEADDAPGGVVIGSVLIMGAVALGANAVLRKRS
jgi:hypothetical protein